MMDSEGTSLMPSDQIDLFDRFAHFPSGSERYIDHPSQAKPGIHVFPSRLCVITMLSNPIRWRSRYLNYQAFEAMCQKAGVRLFTVEVAFGKRKFEITDPANPYHLQLRTDFEIWHKENALNLIAARLPADCEYIATLDADIAFARSDWAQETLHLLQHYDVVQMFSRVHHLGPQHTVVLESGGFVENYISNRPAPHDEKFWNNPILGESATFYSLGQGKKGFGMHTGFAWAYRRSAWNHLGGLLDFAALGSADWHMAFALVGEVDRSLNNQYGDRYVELCRIWQERARAIRENPSGGLGYMPGAILHSFHGPISKRAYNNRWKLLARTDFNPDLDLKRDVQGLWQLTARSQELRDGIRAYNRLRDEDSPVVEGTV